MLKKAEVVALCEKIETTINLKGTEVQAEVAAKVDTEVTVEIETEVAVETGIRDIVVEVEIKNTIETTPKKRLMEDIDLSRETEDPDPDLAVAGEIDQTKEDTIIQSTAMTIHRKD